MSPFQAIFYGILQGLTEFLPVSSSGHLTLAQHLFGQKNLSDFILFDLICHLGTLSAIFLIYAQEIRAVFTASGPRLGQIIVATTALLPLIPLLKWIENLFDHPQYLGYFFITTAFFLLIGIKLAKEKPRAALKKKRWSDALFIGFSQTAAIIPGISRSGTTISTARLLGWSKSEALSFSFLLAIPAIVGGTALKMTNIDLLASATGLKEHALGFLASFVSGYLALLLLIKMTLNEKLLYFVWYCLILGILCVLYI